MTQLNPFSTLGRSFQEKLMQAMIVDRTWAASFLEVFEPDECFEFSHLKLLGSRYISHYQSYKEFPSLELLVSLIRDELKNNADVALREQTITFLKKVNNNHELGDLGWVKDKALLFCRRQAMKKALVDVVDMVEKTDEYDPIVDKLKRAINAGVVQSPGLDYNVDIDARYSTTYRHCIATGIKELDEKKVLNGGVGGGELAIVVAPTSFGKTHCLVHFGAQALLQGKNVVHYTLELNERVTGIRYDSHLVGISSTDCIDNKDVIKEFFQDNMDNLGHLIIKHLPPKSTTVTTLRSHLEKMRIKEFKPDLVIVDYAGIMRSTERYELLRLELKQVVQELRDLAEELDVPIWTALQSNKEGANSEIVDLTNMAEAYAQAHIADFVLGLSRKPENKVSGYGTLYVAKNRAGIDGVQFKIHLDTAQSRIKILTTEDMDEGYGGTTPNSSALAQFRETVHSNRGFFQGLQRQQ